MQFPFPGPEEPTLSQIPAYSMSATGTDVDWKYSTERSTIACLSSGGICGWPRGKMISGSSGTNYSKLFLEI